MSCSNRGLSTQFPRQAELPKKLNPCEIVFVLLGAHNLHGLLPEKICHRFHHYEGRANVGPSPELSVSGLQMLPTKLNSVSQTN